MFLLNNIHDRKYRPIYPDIPGVIFDISDKQLANVKNHDWNQIEPGNIACVVNSSRKISTFCKVTTRYKTDVVEHDGHLHVVTGVVIAKLHDDIDMTTLLNRFGIKSKYLKGNQFSIGFNVANLRSDLDALIVKIEGDRDSTLGAL
jgi:hypothetical protein